MKRFGARTFINFVRTMTLPCLNNYRSARECFYYAHNMPRQEKGNCYWKFSISPIIGWLGGKVFGIRNKENVSIYSHYRLNHTLGVFKLHLRSFRERIFRNIRTCCFKRGFSWRKNKCLERNFQVRSLENYGVFFSRKLSSHCNANHILIRTR